MQPVTKTHWAFATYVLATCLLACNNRHTDTNTEQIAREAMASDEAKDLTGTFTAGGKAYSGRDVSDNHPALMQLEFKDEASARTPGTLKIATPGYGRDLPKDAVTLTFDNSYTSDDDLPGGTLSVRKDGDNNVIVFDQITLREPVDKKTAFKKPDIIKKLYLHQSLLYAFSALDNKDSMLHYMHELEQLITTLPDTNSNKLIITNTIASSYGALNQYEKAIRNYGWVIRLAMQQQDSIALRNAFVNTGLMYNETNDERMAANYTMAALPYLDNDPYSNLIIFSNLADYYTMLSILDSAKYFLSKAEKQAALSKDEANIYTLATKRANLLLYEKKYRAAEPLLENSLRYFLGQPPGVELLLIATSDSIKADKATERLAELQTQYQTYKKEETINSLQKESRIKSLEIQAARRNKTLFLILGIILLATLGILWYIRSLRSKAGLQTLKAKLEMKALRSQMNPHFIFNSLNSIQKYIWENRQEDASEYLTKFARLIRLVLENSRHAAISLEEELNALRLYIEMEHRRNNQKFDYSITLAPDIDATNTFIPPLLLQPYVENAIWHGLSPKDERGKLTVSIEKKNGTLVCTIDDNGIGRHKAATLRTDAIPKTSMAMNISNQRIEWLQKEAGFNATVTITDKQADGLAIGTTVLLTLPLTIQYD
ncbi:histidine kinase [Ostertagia ostertagi]